MREYCLDENGASELLLSLKVKNFLSDVYLKYLQLKVF
jgi:hypothetical protein